MTAATFNQYLVAKDHIEKMKEIDDEIVECYFSPQTDYAELNSLEPCFNEIRILVISKQLQPKKNFDTSPLIFGVKQSDATDIPHKLAILDVSQSDWANIKKGEHQLPVGWDWNRMCSYQDLVEKENDFS